MSAIRRASSSSRSGGWNRTEWCLPRHPDARQVAVRTREEGAIRSEQPRVPQHRWQRAPAVEGAAPAFGDRPDAVPHLGEDLPRQRRPALVPGIELGEQPVHGGAAPLHRLGQGRQDVVATRRPPHAVDERPVEDRDPHPGALDRRGEASGPLHDEVRSALATAVLPDEDVQLLALRNTVEPVPPDRLGAGEHGVVPAVEHRGHDALFPGHRAALHHDHAEERALPHARAHPGRDRRGTHADRHEFGGTGDPQRGEVREVGGRDAGRTRHAANCPAVRRRTGRLTGRPGDNSGSMRVLGTTGSKVGVRLRCPRTVRTAGRSRSRVINRPFVRGGRGGAAGRERGGRAGEGGATRPRRPGRPTR